MKTRSLLIAFTAIACYVVFSSYMEGAATHGGWVCTGAETDQQNPKGCSTGSGCHSTAATPGIHVALELDSMGVPVTHYVGGGTYTVKITGVNTTTSTLPKFGFQIACIVDTVSAVTPTQAGVWSSATPANTIYAALQKYFVVRVVEQTAPLSPASGTGGNGTTYSETFTWTAPVAGTGYISFWASLNAVNNDGNADAQDLWNTTQLNVPEYVVSGIATIEPNAFDMTLAPNPAITNTQLSYTLKENGTVTASIYDIFGKKICDLLNDEQSSGLHTLPINISSLNLKSGMYVAVINNGTVASSKKFIVQ